MHQFIFQEYLLDNFQLFNPEMELNLKKFKNISLISNILCSNFQLSYNCVFLTLKNSNPNKDPNKVHILQSINMSFDSFNLYIFPPPL